MGRKPILKPNLAIIFFLLSLYAFFNLFIYPNFLKSQPQTLIFDSLKTLQDFPEKPITVKIYMYDLPRKFTYGVIKS